MAGLSLRGSVTVPFGPQRDHAASSASVPSLTRGGFGRLVSLDGEARSARAESLELARARDRQRDRALGVGGRRVALARAGGGRLPDVGAQNLLRLLDG